ncbi:MAG TPA: hypothetical protein PKD85_07840 [Saprospiraceae bacterium]|nr:hypothetical protein [Saprospiraceae bacterium]
MEQTIDMLKYSPDDITQSIIEKLPIDSILELKEELNRSAPTNSKEIEKINQISLKVENYINEFKKKVHNGTVQSESLDDFLKNTDAFYITDDDLELIDESDYFNISKQVEIEMDVVYLDNNFLGVCNIYGYYQGELFITNMGSDPTGMGIGTKCIEYLKDKISVTPVDVIDESKNFWRRLGLY